MQVLLTELASKEFATVEQLRTHADPFQFEFTLQVQANRVKLPTLFWITAQLGRQPYSLFHTNVSIQWHVVPLIVPLLKSTSVQLMSHALAATFQKC